MQDDHDKKTLNYINTSSLERKYSRVISIHKLLYREKGHFIISELILYTSYTIMSMLTTICTLCTKIHLKVFKEELQKA